MAEARPCPEPPAPPGAWPGPPRSLGAAPCRGPAAKSSPTAGAVPVPLASGGKLQRGAGAARALPRPNSTTPGCSESGPQELNQPSEKPCHWGGPRHEDPPGGDQQEQQPQAGTGTSAAICHEATQATLPPVACKNCRHVLVLSCTRRSQSTELLRMSQNGCLRISQPLAVARKRPRRPLQVRR